VFYKFTTNKTVSIGFNRNFTEWGNKLESSQLVLGYDHNGFDFKLPIATYNQAENNDGFIMTTALTLAANGLAYYALRRYQASIDKEKVDRFYVQFARYE
jgi:hypothetical protein